MSKLYHDIYFLIARYTDYKTIINMSIASREIKQGLEYSHIWRSKYNDDYGNISIIDTLNESLLASLYLHIARHMRKISASDNSVFYIENGDIIHYIDNTFNFLYAPKRVKFTNNDPYIKIISTDNFCIAITQAGNYFSYGSSKPIILYKNIQDIDLLYNSLCFVTNINIIITDYTLKYSDILPINIIYPEHTGLIKTYMIYDHKEDRKILIGLFENGEVVVSYTLLDRSRNNKIIQPPDGEKFIYMSICKEIKSRNIDVSCKTIYLITNHNKLYKYGKNLEFCRDNVLFISDIISICDTNNHLFSLNINTNEFYAIITTDGFIYSHYKNEYREVSKPLEDDLYIQVQITKHGIFALSLKGKLYTFTWEKLKSQWEIHLGSK